MPKIANCDTVRNVQCVSLGHRPVTSSGPIWTISPTNYPVTPDTHKPREKPEELYKIGNGDSWGNWRFVKLEGGKGLMLLRGDARGVENPAFYDSESQQHLPHHLRPLKTVPTDTASTRLKKRSWIRWWKLRFQKTEKNYRGRCPTCLVLALLLLLVILVIGIAIALYLTVGGGLKSFTFEVEEKGSWVVEGDFRITNRAYMPEMSHPPTSAFGTLASEVLRSMDELFFQSALVRDYNGSEILRLREGSVIVSCRVYLNRPYVNADQQVGMAFIRGLEEGHGTLPAGNLQVDIHSIGFSVVFGVYPPPKSTTEVPIPDASWSQWSGWSSCTDESGQCDPTVVQSRFRDCRTENGVGDALPNTSACRKSGGTRNQVRECQCKDGPRNIKTSSTTTAVVASTTTTTATPATTTARKQPTPKATFPDIDGRRGPPRKPNSQDRPLPTRRTGTTGYRLNPILTTVGEIPFSPVTTAEPMTSRQSPVVVTTARSITEEQPATPPPAGGYEGQQPTKSPIEPQAFSSGSTVNTISPVDATTPVSTCSECRLGTICLLQSGASTPSCVVPKDPRDPRGCGGWCSNANDLCRKFDKTTMYQCIDASECVSDEWRCGNGLCIPEARRCDGHVNCYDQTDEMNCNCKPGEIHCGNKTSCLPADRRCNGEVDCWDGFDEINCTSLCPETQSTCNNGQCIAKEQFCDGYADCIDRSDEPQGCDAPCSTDQFQCRNRRCVFKSVVCDGVDNCGDGSEEVDCRHWAVTVLAAEPKEGQAISMVDTRFEATTKRTTITRRETPATTTTKKPFQYLPVWKET